MGHYFSYSFPRPNTYLVTLRLPTKKSFSVSIFQAIGALLTVAVILGIGLLASNLFGRQFLKLWELLLSRLPFVNSIYSSIKQVSDTLFSESGRAFNKAVLIHYPIRDTQTIAFLTGEPSPDIAKHLKGKYVSVYVPTTRRIPHQDFS